MKNILTYKNICSALIINETQEDSFDHTNGAATPLNQISLLIHTQIHAIKARI